MSKDAAVNDPVPTFTPERLRALSPMAQQIAAMLNDAGYIRITQESA